MFYLLVLVVELVLEVVVTVVVELVTESVIFCDKFGAAVVVDSTVEGNSKKSQSYMTSDI